MAIEKKILECHNIPQNPPEHWTWDFAHSLTSFPGLDQNNKFYCPCSAEMKSWYDKWNGAAELIPNSCTGCFQTLKDLKEHCEKNIDDQWHILFTTVLDYMEMSDSEDEDDNWSTAASVQDEDKEDHNNGEGSNSDSQTNFSGDDGNENGDNNENGDENKSAEESNESEKREEREEKG